MEYVYRLKPPQPPNAALCAPVAGAPVADLPSAWRWGEISNDSPQGWGARGATA